jgi:tetratricopeptide (TPR) repeat protein
VSGEGRRLVIAAAATFLLAAGLFSGALQNQFVSWDDQYYVTANPHLEVSSSDDLLWFFTHSYYWSYIPLTLLSHAADYAVWGLDPRGHHLTSVLLHAANSVWVLLLSVTVIRMARSRRNAVPAAHEGPARGVLLPALVATALFAIHPLRVESVVWVSDRKDLLCSFFLFPAFLLYLRVQERRKPGEPNRALAGVFVLHALALLSKAIALVFPLVMAAADPFLLGRERWSRQRAALVSEKVPFLLSSLLVGVAGLMVVPEQGLNFMIQDLSTLQKALLPFYLLMAPLGKLLVPLDLSPIYDYPPAAVMGIAAILSLFITALCYLLLRRGEPSLLAAWGYFVLFTIPTAAFFASAIQPLADRYSYIAALSFPLLGGVWFDRVCPSLSRAKRWAVEAGVFLLCCAYAVLVLRQVPVWRSSLTLWQHAVEVAPSSPFAHNNLGEALVTSGFLEEAIVSYRLAVELHPRFPDAYNNLGVAQLMRGHHREGEASLERALALFYENGGTDPSIPDVLYNLGTARFSVGDFPGAMQFFRRVLAIRPDFLKARVYIGKTALASGDSLGARGAWEEAARQGSADAEEELLRLRQGQVP